MPTFLLALTVAALAFADDSIRFQEPEIHLWANGAPGSAPVNEGQTSPETWNPSKDGFHRITNIHNPSVTVFLPPKEKANGAAFIICPGGGHAYLVMDLEGSLVAKKLNEMGIAAFVLKSRLAKAPGSKYRVDVESLADVQRAIRLVRSRAREWGVDPARVGIMGFSAGGELAALAETRFKPGDPTAADPIDRVSSRPDVAVLGYPAVKPASTDVPKDTPPTFIVVANDDNLSAASAEYYLKLKAAKVQTELHIYLTAGHGFGMTGRTPAFTNLPVSHWPDQLREWMTAVGFIH